MKILLQHKTFVGYILLMAIIGSMVVIVLHERNRVQKIEDKSITIFQTQHDINTAHRYVTIRETVELEVLLGTTIPIEYRHFLQNISNGTNILVDELCLFGKRKNYIRNSMDATRQPFNLKDAIDEKPRNATSNMFFIGGYSWDGSKLYIDNKSNRVYYCQRYDCTPLKSWNSLSEMIISETERLYSLFDINGKQIKEDEPTIPIV